MCFGSRNKEERLVTAYSSTASGRNPYIPMKSNTPAFKQVYTMDKKPHQPNPSQYTIFDTDLKQPLSIMDVPPSYSQFSPQQQRSLPIREEQHHSPRGELPHSNYHPAYPQQHQPIIERSQNNRKRSRQQSNPSSGQQNSLTSQQDNKPMPEAVVYAPCAQCKGRYDGVECWQAWQFAGAEWQFSVPANIAWLANEGARTD